MQRLREIIGRDTGSMLSCAAEAEVEIELTALNAQSPTPPLRQEFLAREVTILFADLRGFTAMVAGQPAGMVIQMLTPCLIKMSEIIFKHQGTIDKPLPVSLRELISIPLPGRPDFFTYSSESAREGRRVPPRNAAQSEDLRLIGPR